MSFSDRDNQWPSNLLHQMQGLAQNLYTEDQTLYRFWSVALPRNIENILALQPMDTSLIRQAEMADQVYEYLVCPLYSRSPSQLKKLLLCVISNERNRRFCIIVWVVLICFDLLYACCSQLHYHLSIIVVCVSYNISNISPSLSTPFSPC